MRELAILAITIGTALAVNVNDKAKVLENHAETNAATDFTQANCDLTSEFYVPQLPDFKQGDTWPCSYAGTLPSN